MKTKNIIKYLTRFNQWRLWAEIEIPEPKQLTKTIDEAIEKLWYHYEMHQHYKELYEVAIWEIKFNSLQKEHYLSLLDEVEALLDKNIKPSLIKKVIENWKTRWMLDISIHYNELTPDFK